MNDVNVTMTRIITNAVNNTVDNDTLVTLLSLTCLFSILNRNQIEGSGQCASPNPAVSSTTNPIQKILSELSKGDGNGPSPDLLMSLLPLLNNPQVKSKINPSNMATLFSLLNGLSSDKNDKSKNAGKVQNSNEPKETKEDPVLTSSTQTIEQEPEIIEPERHEPEKKTTSHLNWKSNF